MSNQIVDEELAWQASLQLPNGALPMYAAKRPFAQQRVCPYFSCTSALALLLRPARYAHLVRRYMAWHFAHLNSAAEDSSGMDGTIYDVAARVNPDGTVLEKKGGYDSTDSYAALFLQLSQTYLTATGDTGFIRLHAGQLRRVYGAMLATWQDGLTAAKPDFPICYTMDNCEVRLGLLSAEKLFTALDNLTGDTEYGALSTDARTRAKALAEKIEETLWDARAGLYAVGVDQRGRRIPVRTNLSIWYPDAMAQLFPLLTGLLPPDGARAATLYARFQAAQPDNGKAAGKGVWAEAAAYMGNSTWLHAFLSRYTEQVLRAGHPGSLNADCARVALAAAPR